ncbi:hypothetical protein LTS18_006601, partial [Coniosporium uncinatum]
GLVEDAIEKCLNKFNFTQGARNRLREMREKHLLEELQQNMWDKGEEKAQTSNGFEGSKTTIDDNRDEAAVTSSLGSEATGRGDSDTPQPVDDLDQFPIPELELELDNVGSDAPDVHDPPVAVGQNWDPLHRSNPEIHTQRSDRDGEDEEASHGDAGVPVADQAIQDRAVEAEVFQTANVDADSLDFSPAPDPAPRQQQQTPSAESIEQARRNLEEKSDESAQRGAGGAGLQ